MIKDEYVVIAGNKSRPTTIKRGIIERDSGQTIIKETGDTINKRGDVGMPNYTEAWGARVIEEGKVPDSVVNVNDPKYKGKIIWMKWGDTRGYMIVARYLRGYHTLDLQYQDLVLNAKDTIRDDSEAAADAFFLRLQNGDNVFGKDADPMWIEMLKIHYMNGDAVSKSPDSQNALFWEKEEAEIAEDHTKVAGFKIQALRIVGEAAEDNSHNKLRNLYFVLGDSVLGDLEDEHLYPEIYRFADTQPREFLETITQFKRDVSNLFEKFKSYSAIDLTKEGTIVAGKDKKELVADGIPGKKEQMLEWVLANYLDSKSIEVIKTLTTISEKLK